MIKVLPTDQNAPRVFIDGMINTSKRLVLNYSVFVKHAPKMLRDSMMLAYQTAVDDMFKAMDANRVEPVIHEEKPKVTLLDQNGHAT